MIRPLGLGFVALASVFFALTVYGLVIADVTPPMAGVRIGLLLLSILGVIGLIVSMAEIWRRLAERLGAGVLSPTLGLHLHVQGWIGRYIPAKFVGAVGKVVLAEQRGLQRLSSATAAVHEQVYFVAVGGALAASLLLPLPLGAKAALVLLATAFFAMFWYIVSPSVAPLLGRLVGRNDVMPKLTFASHLSVGLAYLVPHLLVGCGFWIMLNALGINDITPVQAVAYLTAAHVAGVLAFIVPAGVGAREAALTALLTPQLGVERALGIAAFTRLWATAGDALAGAYSLLYWRLHR